MLSDYTRTFEKDILLLLRKQNGFKDEITLAGPDGVDVTAISLWDDKNGADKYTAHTYPQVLKTLARFIEGDAEGSNLGCRQLDVSQRRRSCNGVKL